MYEWFWFPSWIATNLDRESENIMDLPISEFLIMSSAILIFKLNRWKHYLEVWFVCSYSYWWLLLLFRQQFLTRVTKFLADEVVGCVFSYCINVKSIWSLVIVHGGKLLIASGEILLAFWCIYVVLLLWCRGQMGGGIAKGLPLWKWLSWELFVFW